MIRTPLLFVLLSGALPFWQEKPGVDPSTGRAMLRELRATLERHYYDPTFGGRSLTELFAPAEQRLESARSTSDVFSALALPLLDLEDSHTVFLPPARSTTVDYGVDLAAIGERVVITLVAPGSDAAAQGVSPGDEVLVLNNLQPTRAELWKMRYILSQLRPESVLVMRLRRSDGTERDVTARARVIERRRIIDLTSQLAIHDLELVFTPDTSEIDRMVRRARDFKTLILDLRGNGGGAIVGLERLASQFFVKPVPLCKTVERKRSRDHTTRAPRQPYTGTLIVLTDSQSASASEMFARIVQLQKRGTIIGDRTAGAVMQSIIVPQLIGGLARVAAYAISVTTADVLMPDGSRLERVGVTPDEVLLPSPDDLRVGRDPVLARAVAAAGGSLSPEEAAQLFPIGRLEKQR